MKKTENIPYASDSPEQLLDLYLPEGPVHDVFVYFHGGGMEQGDKYRSAIFAPWLTDRGVALISANYRMYPRAVYPDFIRDAAKATAWAEAWLRENADGARLFVGGSSAGGYLSMMLCFDRRYLADVGMDNSRIAGYFHDAGQPTAHFNVLAYSGIDGRRVGAFEEEGGHASEGGILHELAHEDFLVVEGVHVGAAGALEGGVDRGGGLEVDFAGDVAAAGAARNLGEELEGALGGAEVGDL